MNLRGCVAVMAMSVSVATAQQLPAGKLLDVMRVRVDGDASAALVTPARGPVKDVRCEVVIVGGGFGGVSAALAAAQGKHTVCMTEPTLWVGGQATSQGVSAFDDNKYIDTTGGTRTYLDLSKKIRMYYAGFRRDTSMTAEQAIKGPMANPGGCWVGRLCFEPEPAEKILMAMLQPAIDSGRLRLWVHTAPVQVARDGRVIRSVLMYDFGHDAWLRLRGQYFVEATERGDLLPLSGLPFRIGAEAQTETHERNAPPVALPRVSQSFTYPFILARGGGSVETEPKPPGYEGFLPHYTLTVDYGKGNFLTYGFYEARKGLPGSFWVYRRSVEAAKFNPEAFPVDRAMINWSSNDHCDANLLSDDPLLQAKAMQDAKRASLGFAWWMRHEVARDDKTGKGYPDLQVMEHAMGSDDGLSQFPYIRESRRIVPLRTIVEEDLAVDFQPGARAKLYPDTVGIGWYPIDIHSCDHEDFVSASKPYEIPLGALIARDADNLIAVGKPIGTTHITNGAYRLHPTEWAIGEAAGTMLVWAMEHHVSPTKIDGDAALIAGLQRELVGHGHPIFWYDDVLVGSPSFAAMQMGGARGWFALDASTLHGGADALMSGAEIANALKLPEDSNLRTEREVHWSELAKLGYKIPEKMRTSSSFISRAVFAQWIMKH